MELIKEIIMAIIYLVLLVLLAVRLYSELKILKLMSKTAPELFSDKETKVINKVSTFRSKVKSSVKPFKTKKEVEDKRLEDSMPETMKEAIKDHEIR